MVSANDLCTSEVVENTGSGSYDELQENCDRLHRECLGDKLKSYRCEVEFTEIEKEDGTTVPGAKCVINELTIKIEDCKKTEPTCKYSPVYATRDKLVTYTGMCKPGTTPTGVGSECEKTVENCEYKCSDWLDPNDPFAPRKERGYTQEEWEEYLYSHKKENPKDLVDTSDKNFLPNTNPHLFKILLSIFFIVLVLVIYIYLKPKKKKRK